MKARGAVLEYRPELDGIRAIAVLAVIAFHAAIGGGPPLWGGFVGVDVFFVLSGFLITTLLLDELSLNGRIGFRAFYARRALRLLPALALLLIVQALVEASVDRALARPYWQMALLASTYAGNWFEPLRNLGPLSHTWSLAIEEQYYLIWPAVLVFATRIVKSQRALAAAIAACAVGSAVLRAVAFTSGYREAADFWTVTRADGILLGSALALAMPYLPDRVRRFAARPIVGLLALAPILAAFFVLDPAGRFTFTGGIFIVVVAATALILHLSCNEDSVTRRCLSAGPLPGIGRISYGLYLFHPAMAVLVFDGAGRGGLDLAALMVALSFAVALASFLLVERPALRMKSRFAAVRRRSVELVGTESDDKLGGVPKVTT